MKLVWHPDAWDEYVSWQTGDRKILKRINALIKDIQRGDDGGIGKPEFLRGDVAIHRKRVSFPAFRAVAWAAVSPCALNAIHRTH